MILRIFAVFFVVFGGGLAMANSVGSMYRMNGTRTGHLITTPLNSFSNVQWSMPLAHGAHCSPIGITDRVILSDVTGRMYGIDRASGTMIWQVDTPGTVFDTPALVVGTGRGYIGSDRDLVCFSLATGATIWTFSTSLFITTSPVVLSDVVYFSGTQGVVYAVDATLGTLIWSTPVGSSIQGSPSVVNGKVISGTMGGDVVCLNQATGQEIWRVNVGQSVHTTVAAENSRLLVGMGHGFVALSQDTGAVQWERGPFSSSSSSPAVANGKVYVAHYVGFIARYDEVTGVEDWLVTLDGEIPTNPVIVSDTLYIGTAAGTVYALNVADGSVRWQHTLPGSVFSDLWVDNAKVYAIVGSRVYALE